MPLAQADLFASPPPAPEGFRYQPELISAEAELALAADIERLPFQPFDFHGHLANRQVVWFGWRYDYGGRRLGEAEPVFPQAMTRRKSTLTAAALPPVFP